MWDVTATPEMEYGKTLNIAPQNGDTYGNGVALCFGRSTTAAKEMKQEATHKTICFTLRFRQSARFFFLEFSTNERERE